MPKHPFSQRLNTQVKSISSKPKSLSRIRTPSNKPPIRKRHWFSGSVLILIGSWITHTTTANIATPKALTTTETVAATPPPTSLRLSVPKTEPTTQAVTPVDRDGTGTSTAAVDTKDESIKIVRHAVKRGESLGTIFRKKGYDLGMPYKISKHPIAKRLVSLSVGKELTFNIDASESLVGISYPTSSLEELHIKLKDKQIISAETKAIDYQITEHTVSANINSSLFLSAQKAGLSHNLIMEMVRIFGWDIDFALDIRAGDSYHIIYTNYEKEGKKIADGNILAAEFMTQGRRYRAIRFVDSHNNVSYYTPEGNSMLGTFLRSPVKFSRISSRFGKRKHPISKKWKTHKGTDYAAARGTPIRATADGKVTLARRNGGYGKTVVLRHAGRFSTLYAHMNGFAKGIRSGSRVKQGDIIGYVGTTGYSTGPHLHYEFRVNGVHRNSLTYKTPKASSIGADSKNQFELLSNTLTARLDSIEKNYVLAQSSTSNTSTL